MDAARGASFAADQDEGPQGGSGRPIPPLVSKIQVTTTNAGARAQGGLTPDFLALSFKELFRRHRKYFIYLQREPFCLSKLDGQSWAQRIRISAQLHYVRFEHQAPEEGRQVVSHPAHPVKAFLVIDPLFKIVRACLGALAVLRGSPARNPDGTDNVAVYEKRNTALNGNRAMQAQHP
jgi:hypothetical protein